MRKLLLFITLLTIILTFASCSKQEVNQNDNAQAKQWCDNKLSILIPEPSSNEIKFIEDSEEELNFSVEELSEEEFQAYVKDCKEKGFTVDAKEDSYSYEAYNNDGYHLDITYLYKKLDVALEVPMKFDDILWPTSKPAKSLPIPEFSGGNFSFDNANEFAVYLKIESEQYFHQYVNECIENGFVYSKKGTEVYHRQGDHSYTANNGEFYVTIKYEGCNIIFVRAGVYKEKETTESKNNNSKIDPDFKEAMDSYEKFMDEYVDILKKYSKNPTDTSILTKYTEYMSEYADMVAKFEKWENEDLNDAELKYYIAVQGRVSKKLAQVSG